MIHKMKLQDKYFYFILNGTKRIEIRLNDDKRKLIKVGDIIEFKNADNLENCFRVKVIELLRYNSFNDLLNDYDISILADKSMTKEQLINVFEQFYTQEEQKKYGILGIKIELIK